MNVFSTVLIDRVSGPFDNSTGCRGRNSLRATEGPYLLCKLRVEIPEARDGVQPRSGRERADCTFDRSIDR